MFLFFLENHDGQGGIRYQKRERFEQAVVLKMKYEPCFKERWLVKKKSKVTLLTTCMKNWTYLLIFKRKVGQIRKNSENICEI